MAAVGHRTALRAPRLASAAPWIVLGIGSVLVALSATLIAIRINGLASLDELVYRVSAVTYTDSFPSSVVHDPVARGTARLYSLVIAPIFAVLEGDTALRTARGLNGVLFAAASVPVALVGRRLTGSTWAGVAAGLLSVAVPWITVSTLLFSEALAYLLFAWTIYAMVLTLAAPSPRRDLLVLGLMAALVTTRVQFIALPFAWLAVVLILERGGDRRLLVRRYPFLLGGAALVLLGLLVITVAGRLDQVLTSVGGPYSEIKDRGRPPSDAGVAVGYHGGMLLLGLGFATGALLFPWLRVALSRRAGVESHRFAVLGVAVVVALFIVTISAQNGWSDGRAEERYYLYAVPFVWCAAVAAVRLGTLRASSIAWTGVALTAVLMLVPLNISLENTQAVYGPVGGSVNRILDGLSDGLADALGWKAGPTPRDALAIVLLLVTAATAALWSRFPGRCWLVLVVPVALQLVLTVYALELLRGNVDGVPGMPLGPASDRHAWVDRGLPDGATASLVENRRGGDVNGWVDAVLWNDQIRDRVRLPSALVREPPYPIGNMPGRNVEIAPDLRITPGLPRFVATMTNSPLWQIEGERVTSSRKRGDQELVAPAAPARARWHASGVDGDGQVTKPVDLALAPGYRATLLIGQPAHVGASQVEVRLAGKRHTVDFPAVNFPVRLDFSTCGATRVSRGTIRPTRLAEVGDGRRSGGVLVEAQLNRC